MKITKIVMTAIVGLLSIAAGAAKIMLVPEEAKFLAQFGFNDTLTVVFGLAQVIGGCLVAIPLTKLYGAGISTICFATSLAMILSTGNLAFAAVSVLPVLLSGFLLYQGYRATNTVIEDLK